MEEKPEQPSIWIRLYHAGVGVEFASFFLLGLLGAGISLALGWKNILSMLILSFGLPKVFWSTVRKLAIEDGLQEPEML